MMANDGETPQRKSRRPRLMFSDDELRAMYVGHRGNATARRYARLWARVMGWGVLPRRWITLEVVGRSSGRPTTFPLGMADLRSEWYLVSMLGDECNWVKNVRAANGRAVIRHRAARPCTLVEIPVADRAPILQRYVAKVPGARPHMPIDQSASLAEFAALAPLYPAFHVVYDGDRSTKSPRQ